MFPEPTAILKGIWMKKKDKNKKSILTNEAKHESVINIYQGQWNI
jgi:hypothetical protein